jgi:ribokinase
MKALSPLLKKTYILFINKDEIEKLIGEDFVVGAKECLKQGCQIVVVTLGKGLALKSGKVLTSYICDRNREYELELSPDFTNQLEVTGAGDAFAAGFLFGLLKGRKLNECGQLGNAMAHYAMNDIGARKGLPTLPTLKQMLPSIINF